MRTAASRADNARTQSTKSSTRAKRSTPRGKQRELVFPARGGARPGAGRKPKGARAGVPHVTRPEHKERFPVLVTTRLIAGLPSLRRPREAARIRAALARAMARARAIGDARARFQIVHHSIQSNHLHLIVEARDRAALTSGMRGFLIRVARSLNRLLRRRGTVCGDRFHARELRSPREVRNALVSVLQNLRKHGIAVEGPDPLSSGPGFDGWRATGAGVRFGGNAAPPEGLEFTRAARIDVPPARTWLLGVGWRRHGLIGIGERPSVG